MTFNNSSFDDSPKIKKNVPLPSKKSVLNHELVHKRRRRKYTKRQQVKELAKKKYDENGGAITILDLQLSFRINKAQAQRLIKHLHMEKFLFTADDLKKQGIVLKGKKRERPQKYYLTEMKAKIIEDNKNNVQNDTTGISPIDNQKIQNLQDVLIRISLVMLYIHKLQIMTFIDKKYYNDIKDIMPAPINGAKTYNQRIGAPHGSMNVKYVFSPNGTLMIYIKCSENPFRIHEEEDISIIMVFLGRIYEILRSILSYTRDEILPPVNKWILTGCDVNKDIEIDGITQLTLPSMQMPLVEKALRAYVKVIGDKAYLRAEKFLTPNQPIGVALENIRNNVDLDKDLSYSNEDDGCSSEKENNAA